MNAIWSGYVGGDTFTADGLWEIYCQHNLWAFFSRVVVNNLQRYNIIGVIVASRRNSSDDEEEVNLSLHAKRNMKSQLLGKNWRGNLSQLVP